MKSEGDVMKKIDENKQLCFKNVLCYEKELIYDELSAAINRITKEIEDLLEVHDVGHEGISIFSIEPKSTELFQIKIMVPVDRSFENKHKCICFRSFEFI